MNPEIGRQEYFFFGSDDTVGHMAADVGQGGDNGQGEDSVAAHQRRRDDAHRGILFEWA